GPVDKAMRAGMPADYFAIQKVNPSPYSRWSGGAYPTMISAAKTTIPSYICPSATNPPSNQIISWTYYTPDPKGGTIINWGSLGVDPTFGITNYIGCAGYAGLLSQTAQGVYLQNSSISMTQITGADGTSNTLAFGEVVGGAANGANWSYAWMGAGSELTGFGLKSPETASFWHFSSYHTGVVQF